jgi:exosortase
MNLVVLLLLALGALAHLPFVTPQLKWMWDSEHYGFYPFAIAAFCWLAWERMKGADVKLGSYITKRTTALLVFNVLLLSLATLADSNWIGWVSFLVFLWTAAHIVLPPDTAKRIRQPYLVLLLIVPLPLGLDSLLVIEMQKLATRQGSLLLDYFGIMHAVEGVTVHVPGHVFMIDEACSGIHSLFSAVTAMLVFAVLCRYSIWRTAFTVAQAVLWVLIVNAIRVFVVVYTTVRWGNLGLESGWRHQALGFVCYVLILALAFSTDQFLRYLIRLRAADSEEPKRRTTWRSRIAAWLDRPFSQGLARAAGYCFAVMFLLVGGVAAAQSWRTMQGADGDNFSEALAFQLGETDMPEVVDGWRRVSFKAENRDKGDILGMNSMIWTYERDGIVAQFSIDGAYPSFHDLTYCYTATGWELKQADIITIDSPVGDSENAVATALQLYKDNNEQAYVLFTCIDSVGNVVEPPAPSGTLLRQFLNRVRAGKLLEESQGNAVPPVIQFQAVTSQAGLFEHEREEFQTFFARLREAASQRVLGQVPPQPDSSPGSETTAVVDDAANASNE